MEVPKFCAYSALITPKSTIYLVALIKSDEVLTFTVSLKEIKSNEQKNVTL